VTSGAFQTENKAYIANNGNATNAFVAKFGIGTGEVLTATEASITPDANPAAEDELVTFTAYIAQSTACGFPPTGTVDFAIDGGVPIPVKLDDTGHAIYQTATLATGTHTIAVSYSGDSKYSTSTATYKENITVPPATLAIAAGSGQTSVYGTPYKTLLTVLVKDAKGNPSPGVIVTFTGTGLKFSSSTAITASNGEASVTATPTAAGTLKAMASAEDVKATGTFDLTSTTAALTVTANNLSVPYGKAIPALTDTIIGFVNGDTSAVVTGKPTLTTTGKQDSLVGTYPITVAQGTLAATNYTFKLVNGTLTITFLGTTATPTFTPAAATYSGTQKITLTDTTSGATIYFTLNGATPTTSSTKYTSPISVGVTETIKAIAVTLGYANSAVATAAYTIK
jgi:MBG domain (YGX type)/Chitobiase/beta-hexosaminidase C-terminal domain/Bacterial Ig-like domain (group 3)/Bacterial Ig-like domain (group 1)